MIVIWVTSLSASHELYNLITAFLIDNLSVRCEMETTRTETAEGNPVVKQNNISGMVSFPKDLLSPVVFTFLPKF